MSDENTPLEEEAPEAKEESGAEDAAVDVQDGSAEEESEAESAEDESGAESAEQAAESGESESAIDSIDDEVEKEMLAQLAEEDEPEGEEDPSVDDIVDQQMLAELEVMDDADGSSAASQTEIKKADFQQLTASAGSDSQNLNLLLDVNLPIAIELGRTEMTVQDILSLGPGSVVELNKLAGEPVDLLVNNKVVAKGEVVVIDENFGLRVTSLISPEDRLKSLGD